MTAAGGNDRPAAAATGVAGVSVVTAAVSSVATTDVSAVVATSAAAATTASAAAALTFSAVALSVPVAMHLSRYGRLPSWNKSRTQCLVIFHSSTMKEILAMAICYVIFLFHFIAFKYVLYKILFFITRQF